MSNVSVIGPPELYSGPRAARDSFRVLDQWHLEVLAPSPAWHVLLRHLDELDSGVHRVYTFM